MEPESQVADAEYEVCPREAIERDAAEAGCARAAINEAAAGYECAKAAIERDAANVCPRESIDADIASAFRKDSPVIGIVPTQMPQEHLLRVNDYYINSIVLSGGVPLILPITDDAHVFNRLLPVCDGFILTGGQDVDPERYGIAPESPAYEKVAEITPMRDAVEKLILDYACARDVPLLGICRGMQTMNVHFGGTLYVDLPEQFDGCDSLTGEPIMHWQAEEATETTHYVQIVRDSKLSRALGTQTAAVNSFHHQGVCTVAPALRAVARGADGLVEAIENPACSFMLGVQWHPEFFLGEKHTGNLFAVLCSHAIAARLSGRLD